MPTYKLNGFDGQKYHIPSNNDVLESECDVNVAGKIAITVESTTPPQPPDGEGFLYSKNDGKLYWRSFDVGETDLTGGGGGGGSPSGMMKRSNTTIKALLELHRISRSLKRITK